MKLHNILELYLLNIENAVELMSVYVEQYQEEVLTDSHANLRLRLRFHTGHLLAINEAVIIENNQLQCLGYRYHFQDERNKLIFRYDDTPHFPNLESFPHHKHWFDEVLNSEKPEILAVLKETQELT